MSKFREVYISAKVLLVSLPALIRSYIVYSLDVFVCVLCHAAPITLKPFDGISWKYECMTYLSIPPRSVPLMHGFEVMCDDRPLKTVQLFLTHAF